MALETGTRIGVYEVTGKLGEGGMGEVYRAHDTTLDRDVALKVLSEAFTADPDRLARFQREAKVLASLNHPNIGGIYGLEAAGESQALVLELIEGPTLADRIAEGAIPVDDALTIARQIADALEVAHDQGIVHRDLKPANVKVRSDGTVKVLDFGLAKAVTSEASGTGGTDAPTISLTGATQMGMVVGTAAYMSPEQAKGKAVDKRTDVWAFGAVLYEMLTGRKAFPGDDVSDTLASVLAREPELASLPSAVPSAVSRLLTRCFEKNPKKRLRDVTEGFVQLDDAMARPEVTTGPGRPAHGLQAWQLPIPALVAVLGVAVLSALAVWILMRPEITTASAVRFSIAVPETEQLSIALSSTDVAISPDGRSVAYLTGNGTNITGPKELYLRTLGDFTPIALAGNEPLYSPFFSPDNEWVGFYSLSNNELRRVSVTGGSAIPIADMPGSMQGASWGGMTQLCLRRTMRLVVCGGSLPAAENQKS